MIGAFFKERHRMGFSKEAVSRATAHLALAAVVLSTPLGFAQAPGSNAQLTDTPVAPPPTEAMRVAAITRDNSRHFGSDPGDPGPLSSDVSAAMNPDAVAHAIRLVADWQLGQGEPWFSVSEPPLLDGRIWTWNVLYTGYVAAYHSLNEEKYRMAMEEMGSSYHWELRSKVPGADDLSLAQTYLELYMQDKQPEEIAPTKEATDAVLARPWVGHGPSQPIEWWWCDALFMAPPVWARMYAATGDRKYITYLNEQWAKTSDLLYDPETHLYFRDNTFIHQRGPNGKKVFWSRGEGWVMGGLARTLEYLPKDDPARAKYEGQLKDMSAALAKLQGSDGLWRSSLLDPKDFPAPEISGSALITYGMAWGVNHGVLDRKVYEPIITKAWAGMLHHIYADGRLGDIQQTGAQPSTYKPSASYNYGVGGFLLAGSEIWTMLGAAPTAK